MLAFDLELIDYNEALLLQQQAQELVISGAEDIVFFLEHFPTISIGKNFGANNVPPNLQELWKDDVTIVHSTRGGNITCHFPGQLVIYPIINIKKRHGGLRGYVHDLEQVAINTLTSFGIHARRIDGLPGVWIDNRKIASLGLAVNHHVTMHGMALNVAWDISLFNIISPCGLDVSATSIHRELTHTKQTEISMQTVKEKFLSEFIQLFQKEQQSTPQKFLTKNDFLTLLHS